MLFTAVPLLPPYDPNKLYVLKVNGVPMLVTGGDCWRTNVKKIATPFFFTVVAGIGKAVEINMHDPSNCSLFHRNPAFDAFYVYVEMAKQSGG
jgi:hypothetical protein